MVDNPRYTRISERAQRCLEGLIQGTAMLGVGYLTCLWLNQRVEVVFKNVDLRYLNYVAPRTMMTMVMGAAVGFVIGFFIPTWYRRHQEQSAQERTRSLTLVPAAPPRPAPTVLSASVLVRREEAEPLSLMNLVVTQSGLLMSAASRFLQQSKIECATTAIQAYYPATWSENSLARQTLLSD